MRPIHGLLLLVLVPALLAAADAKPSDAQPSDAQLVAWLEELQPLPKIHYSWPLPFKSVSDELLYEYARITHAVSLSGEWHHPDEIERAVRVCQRVNEGKPTLPCSLAVNHSVWHRRFGKDLPPTDTGPTQQAELDYLKSRMEAVRAALAAANQKQGANIVVSAVLFDSEHFHVKPDDAAWNQAITAKYNAAYDTVRETFPQVRVEWYARGAVQPGAAESGWSQANYFALDEQGESFGCSLYQVPEIGYTREIFRRTVANADRHGVDEVTPWIALASGYRRQTEQYHEWSSDWDYDLIYSWMLGREINQPWFSDPVRHERFAPWSRAKIAIFYPEPFGQAPHWAKHFVAYVRGAHMIKTLPEVPESDQTGEKQ